MPATLTVPRLGMGNTGGLVAEWYAEEGAWVVPGDAVFRMESDYVSLDIESEAAGVVRHVVPAGIPQFEGGVVGFILAPGERMPKVEGLDDWGGEPGGGPEASLDPAPVAFTAGGRPAGFGAPDGRVPVQLRPRRRTDAIEERPGLWEQVTEAKEDEPLSEGVAAAAAPQPLVIRVAVPMNEAVRLRERLVEEWKDESLTISDEAVIVRAVGRVLEERDALAPFRDEVGLRILAPNGPDYRMARRPGKRSFREVVAALRDTVDEPAASVIVVSYIAFAVDSAEPRLGRGQAMVIGVARPVVTTAVTLTLVYDPEQIDDHDAAAFLGRVRTLLVQPHALLAE